MTVIAPPPVPPAAPAPTVVSPSARSGLRALIVVVAALLVGGSVIALSVTAFGLSRFRVVADEQSLPSDVRALVIDTSEVPAAVTLTTDRDATEPRVSMRMVNAARSDGQALAIAQQGGTSTVTVSGRTPDFPGWARGGQITVTLPPALARGMSITVQQDAGVVFARADLDELIVHGTDGAVVLSGGARRIEVHDQNGDVVSREPISVTESFLADTVDGDVTVDFADAAPRRIEATTSSGDVVLGLPTPGPYLVRADSAWNTTVRVPETTDPERAVAAITARSDDGTVTVSPLNGDDRRHR